MPSNNNRYYCLLYYKHDSTTTSCARSRLRKISHRYAVITIFKQLYNECYEGLRLHHLRARISITSSLEEEIDYITQQFSRFSQYLRPQSNGRQRSTREQPVFHASPQRLRQRQSSAYFFSERLQRHPKPKLFRRETPQTIDYFSFKGQGEKVWRAGYSIRASSTDEKEKS